MFLDLQDHVEIARRSAVRSGFAFASDAQARAGVHAGRNAQLDGFFALHTALTVAIGAPLTNNLSRALACRARARDGKETLLIGQLAAAAASLAGDNAGAFFCAGPVASFAVLLAGQLDFSGHASRRLFKREGHVIAQIGPALSAGTAGAPGSEEIFETKEITENVVEIAEGGIVEVHAAARAGESGVTVGVVNFTFLRIAQDTVCFRALAELYFGFFFVLRVAIGVPLQRGLPIGRLDLLDGRGARHAKYFVKISLVRLGHAQSPFFVLVRINLQLLSMRRPGERLRGPWRGAERAHGRDNRVERLAE